MVIGVFLAVTDTPDLVKGFLHRAGLAVSQPTARSVLESLSDASTNRARQLMKDKRRMKVFLFDNINVYMRRSQIRLMDYNTAVALTMRTLFTLPSSCSPTSITCNHIELLQKADRRAMDTRDVMPDDAFLERAATIHIAEALIDMAKLGSRERGAIIRRLDEMRREHADDVLGPEQTAFVQMKLMREDEGTLEGTQTVLTETVKELGLEFEKEGVQPLLVSGDLLSSWIYLVFKTHFSSSSVGADASLDRARDVLRRGRNALREDKPLFNEAWDFCQIVWKGRLGAILAEETQQSPSVSWAPNTKGFFRHAAATKAGDIGRMRSVERFMGIAFLGGGQHNYAHLVFDRILADIVLPKSGAKTLRCAQLVNRTGKPNGFEGADHFQETMNKEVQIRAERASTSSIVSRTGGRRLQIKPGR
ncbi:hypothetical protein OC834_003788 [Tilletia horrida]|nr:hypothetical protein OC834_003788 [Tilletia horrida]